MINADKPQNWKTDTFDSVQMYNTWFFEAAPRAFRDTRGLVVREVEDAFVRTSDLAAITPKVLATKPKMARTLRMCTAPPIAQDRLIGLSGVTSKNMLNKMEASDVLPVRMPPDVQATNLSAMCEVFTRLLDTDLFPWLSECRAATSDERYIAATVVADRLCGADADPIVRNAQERRQLALIEAWLTARGYVKQVHPAALPLKAMKSGTFSFRQNVVVGGASPVNIPVDVVIQPHNPTAHGLPILIEAKSAGDFTNTNKRRKEEAQKLHQLRDQHGPNIGLLLFLCGYFDGGYLGYSAQEGLDWVWEHRIDDLAMAGV